MAEQLYSHFADMAALNAEKEQILNIYGEIKAGILDLNKLGFKIDSAKGIAETAEVTRQLEKIQQQLILSQKKLAESEERLAKAREEINILSKQAAAAATAQTKAYTGLSDELSVNIQRQIELKNRLDAVNKQLKNLGQFTEAARGTKEFNDEVVRLTEEQVRLKTELSDTNKFIKNQSRELESEEGSLDSLRAKLNQMLQVYDALGEAGKASPGGQGALKQIQALTEEIKKQEFDTKRFQRNVGNYSQSAQIIVEAFERSQKRMEQFRGEVGKQGPAAEEARKEYEALSRVVENPQFLNISAKVGDTTAETKFFTRALKSLSDQGLENSDVAKLLKDRLADLEDQTSDLRDEISAMASDTRGFDLFASSVGTAASIFQTGAGAAELFGASTEDVEASIQRLTAIQSVANGVRQIATDLTTRGTAANKAYAFVQGLVATVTNGSATATQRLGAALKLAGIGLLIGALGFLADKMGVFGSQTSEAEKDLENFDNELARSNTLVERQIKTLNRQLQLQLEYAKQRSGNEAIQANITEAFLDQEARAYERLSKTQSDAVKKQAKELTDFAAQTNYLKTSLDETEFGKFVDLKGLREEGIPTLEKAQQALDRIEEYKLTDYYKDFDTESKAAFDLLEKRVKAAATTFEKASDIRSSIELNNEKEKSKAAEEQRKKDEEAADKAKKAREEAAEKAKKYAQEERKAIQDLSRFRLETLAAEQEAYKNADLSDPGSRATAAKNEFELRKKIIQDQLKFDLETEGQTKTQRILAREIAGRDIANLESALGLKLIQITHEYNQQILDEAKAFNEEYERQQDEALQAKLADADKVFKRSGSSIEKAASEERAALSKRYQEGTITTQEYNVQLGKINENSQRSILTATIEFYEKQVSILKTAGYDTLETETALAKAREELVLSGLDKRKFAQEKELELSKELIEKYRELGSSIVGAFNSVVQGAFDKRKNQIQDEMDLIDQLKEREIDRINSGADSEERKAARIAIVNAKAASDKEALERKQRQIDRQKAIFDRTFQAFQITIGGIKDVARIKSAASAVFAEAMATTSNPILAGALKASVLAQIPLSIATTAANLVAVLATPIPKFWRGTMSSPAGLAQVAERGPELGIERSGTVKLWENETLAMLDQGTKIFPADVTRDVLKAVNFDKRVHIKIGVQGSGQVVYIRDDKGEEIVDELKGIRKQQGITIINQHGIESSAYYQQQMKY